MISKKLIFPSMVLVFSMLACNMQRVLDPSLPTLTPPSPTETPLPSATPFPTPLPTADPGSRIALGDKALFNGDWGGAIRIFSENITNPDANIQAAALLGLGRAYYFDSQYTLALDPLRVLLDNYPQSAQVPAGYFFLGEVYNALARHSEAAVAYQQYQVLRPGLLDFYMLQRAGDAHLAAGDANSALTAYINASRASHLPGYGADIQIAIGDIYAQIGDFQSAILTYKDIITFTNNDYTKASMLYRIGQAQQALGEDQAAYAVYQEAVMNYPLSYDSYLALVELVDAGVDVDELDRGLVDHFAGQYVAAIPAFDRYLDSNPEMFGDTALYYKGLGLQAASQFQSAINAWQKLIDNHPQSEYYANAWDEIAHTLYFYMDLPQDGIDSYVAFVDQNPEHPRAPEFLYFAARIAERQGDLAQAAQLWSRIGMHYSLSTWGYDGFFQAGIVYYRQRDFLAAHDAFQSTLGLASNPTEQARAYFWIGKAMAAMDNMNAAITAWEQASTIDPTGYYSERAVDILNNRAPFTPPAEYNTSFDVTAERAAAEEWMRATFGIAADTDLSGPGPLAGDLRFQRGTALWELGLYNEARSEFENLRQEVSLDPVNSYRLGNYMIDLGLYRPGITAIRQVLNIAGMDDAGTFNAPPYFNYLRFGFYYEDIVFPVATAHDIHPLFFFSVLRQESLFEGFVTSTAGARGLMQIIPSTGQSLADRGGWPANYTAEDLYRPLVSINFGADYLATQRNALGGDLGAALAAYNGGPGNASAWRSLSGDDFDLFVEVIRFEETRNYLRGIYELFTIYKGIWGIQQ